MSHTALRLAGITKRYRSNTVLGPIDPSLEEGRILAMVGLADAGNKRVRSFSPGMRKRLDLRKALFGQPCMLVLDEPTKHTGRRMATRGAIASCRVGRCGDFRHARPMSRQKVDYLCDLPP